MAKEHSILTIDVGGDNLKIAEFVFSPAGAIVLRNFAFRKLAAEQEGDAARVFAEAYNALLEEHKFTARQVRLSISGQNSFSRLGKLPPLMGNQSAVNKIVEFEARQTVPYAMDEVVWDYQLLRHAWTDTRIETQEDGSALEISDEHEEYEALFVAVKTDQITQYTDVIQDSGREILSVEIAPVALFNAAKATQCRDDECVLILNIGGRGSNLMIADHNRVFMRSIPIAGDAITLQVAKEFGIGFDEAEDLKQRHGFIALGGAYEEPESEVAAIISKIARNVMTRLHGEVSRSVNVWRSSHGGNAPTRVLLSGGGSTMLYITDFFQEKLRLPVEYLNTFGAITIDDGVDKEALQAVAPMFQELIGMSLRSVTQCPIDISLVPESIKKQKELDRKKIYFYISAVSLILCLLIFAFGVNRRLNFDKARVERVKSSVEDTNSMMNRVDGLMSQYRAAKGEYDAAFQFLKDRDCWSGMLSEIQQRMPDHIWLTSIVGIGEVVEPVPENPGDMGLMGLVGGADMMGLFSDPNVALGQTEKAETVDPDPIKIHEVKEIRLRGYSLLMDDESLLETELREKLCTDSRYFVEGKEEGSTLVKYDTSTLNTTAFEIVFKLKEPIRK